MKKQGGDDHGCICHQKHQAIRRPFQMKKSIYAKKISIDVSNII